MESGIPIADPENNKKDGTDNMARVATNKNLQQAREAKSDEFYTRLADVEKELKHYRQHFRNKVVLCNCDDPRVSNFFRYFSYNFEKLGLIRLITTCYKNQDVNLFNHHDKDAALYLEYEGDKNRNRIPDVEEIGIKTLKGDGDFRSRECIELLKEADIVVTNPPFSLFREYVAQLVEYDKKFLVVGTWNAITYRDIFRLIQSDRLWIGVNCNRDFSGFIVPDHYPLHGTEARVDEYGDRVVSSNNTCWFTNLENAKRHENLPLYCQYNSAEHPEYDNYNAVEVNQVVNIPINYDGVMGVPITFLNKYNPSQFEIVGSDYDVKEGLLHELVKPSWNGKIDRAYLDGKRLYARLFIKRKTA